MEDLPTETRASYIVMIDEILANADLQTISSKRIRAKIQSRVDYDIGPHKDAIKELIMERYDKFAEAKDPPSTNGHTEPAEPIPTVKPETRVKSEDSEQSIGHKRKAPSDDDADADGYPSYDASDNASTPPKKRKSVIDDDAMLAAKLQAEENSRARPTRGGHVRKAPIVKKKKKTAAKISANDDSDLSGSDAVSKRKVNKNSGFHKEFVLSTPLSELLDGETQLSRPQTVKRIWAYIKARDLQDPKDKRQIRCDDALRAVFKADKVHMFSMNKILSTQLYDPDA